jgi:hypothetical protein
MPEQGTLDLRRGEVVTVRSATEILAELDEDGRLDGLPFMPEMLQFCGRSFPVYRRADKTCDTIEMGGLREMTNTVHLADLRCDGSGHKGCQAACLLFWKESWLTRSTAGFGGQDGSAPPPPDGVDLLTRATLRRETQGDETGRERFSCQATELLGASRPLVWWDPRQYVRDVRTGNVGVPGLVRGLSVFLFNKYQGFSKRVLPARLRIREGRWYPFIAGTLRRTPSAELGLQPGDLVEVKSKDEILATLNADGKNRGLKFDSEMLRYCGQRARVLRRVEHILDERTGEMLDLRDCIVLEGSYCRSDYHRFCPRSIHHYWREIWLRRAE